MLFRSLSLPPRCKHSLDYSPVDELRDQPELLKQLSSLLLFSDSHESPEWHTMCTLEHRTLCHVTQPLLTRIEEHLPATQSVPELVEILRYLLWTADQYRPSDEYALACHHLFFVAVCG